MRMPSGFHQRAQGLPTPSPGLVAGVLTSSSLAQWTLTIYTLTPRTRCSSGKSTWRSDFPALSVWCGIHPCWRFGTLDGGHLAPFPSLPQPFLSYAAWEIKDNQVHPQSISQVDKLKLVAKIVDLTSNKKRRLFQRLVWFFFLSGDKSWLFENCTDSIAMNNSQLK